MMGRRTAAVFQTYHRGLYRAVWSPLTARRLRLRLCGAGCLPTGVVVFGLDDTSERRRGEPSTAHGISRDPGRSAHAPVVTARGVRWLACLGLTPRSWAARVWARPVRTVLGPSERC